jgi:stage II sporulation protein D
MVRVRLEAGVDHVLLGGGPGQQIVVSASGQAGPADPQLTLPVRATHASGSWALTDATGGTLRWARPDVRLTTAGRGLLQIGERAVPGTVSLHAVDRGIDVVNHVPMEQYLPGVLERELFASWHPEAYRAQAIAARTYTLWEMTWRRGPHHDLEATVASQAYAGVATRPVAVQAVRDTRGQVLSFDGRVLPAFYSSTCGGTSQDAAAVFGDRVPDLAPLRGQQRASWCAPATRHRWTTVRDGGQLAQRLNAWLAAQRRTAPPLTRVDSISVRQRNAAGRPTDYTVVDQSGAAYAWPAEDLRFAANHDVPGLPPVGESTLWSSFWDLRPVGGVLFVGRGYGHGVGLCQWGVQGMAAAGNDHRTALVYFYPGTRITRLYP